ncbi:MAG: methyltransferase domain-containing protein [Anaerolineales bacterium]|nr:methyltransferase domain-containing protein [Anaerolineales bacterium]
MNDESLLSISDTTNLNTKATAVTRARYRRIAPVYDFLEILPELRYRPWRTQFWQTVATNLYPGGQLLEIGVGTGNNMPFWPKNAQITAVDLNPSMLKRAKSLAERLGIYANIELGDVQALAFPDNTFDVAAATFVFCSVPDPVLGLKELMRVVRPGGWVFLMEHVRAQHPIPGKLMDLLNPLVARTMGPNINRDTVGNVQLSGLELVEVNDLGMGGIFKIISAYVGTTEKERAN